jgi:hypothetical protein
MVISYKLSSQTQTFLLVPIFRFLILGLMAAIREVILFLNQWFMSHALTNVNKNTQQVGIDLPRPA